MQTVRGNSAKKYLLIFLIFAIVLFIYPLYTTAERRIFTHVEENDSYLLPAETPRIIRLRVYDDGTAVARIVRKNRSTTVNIKTCFHEIFSLRIIRPNGTVDEKDIKLNSTS